MIWCITIVLIILLYGSVILGRKYIKNLHDNIYDITITIISVFVGALLAIKTTSILNESEEKDNYASLLKSSIKMDEHYLEATRIIIDSVSSKPINYFEVYSSIKNVNQPFILIEIINNGYLYKFASDYFKNYLPLIISLMQSADLTISRENINTYRLFYNYLVFKQELLNIELKYVQDEVDQSELIKYYLEALKTSFGSLIESKNDKIRSINFFSDSIDTYEESFDFYNNSVLDRFEDTINVYQLQK